MTVATSSALRIGVLGSGAGSNMQSLLHAIRAGTLDAEIRLALSDVPDAGILTRARANGVPCDWMDCAPYRTKLDGDAEQRCIERLLASGVDTVVLAGFMRVVKPRLLSAFRGRVLNIHPSLLPAFPGLRAWQQALDYGAKVSGCTVHFVDEGVDTGPIICQRAVPVFSDDTPESLHARIQIEERLAYPEACRLLAAHRLSVQGRHVRILPERAD